MGKIKFKLLATNGKWTKEFMYFLQVPKGDIYYGEINLQEQDKTSRHVSGISHHKRGERMIKLGKGLKLTECVGLHQLFVISIGKAVFLNEHFGAENTKNNKYDILIDVRNFNLRVGIMAFFLEPNKLDALNTLKEKLNNVELKVFMNTNPWVVIAIYENGNEIPQEAKTKIDWNKAFVKMEIPSSETGGNLVMINVPAKKR